MPKNERIMMCMGYVVTTEEEERERSRSRQRESLNREKKRLANQGNSTARYYGYTLPENWWKPKKFALLKESLPEYLLELLEVWQQLLVPINEALKQATAEQEKASAKRLPVGLGALTATGKASQCSHIHILLGTPSLRPIGLRSGSCCRVGIGKPSLLHPAFAL